MPNKEILPEFNAQKNRYLLFSIILDLLGMATYLFPLLAEVGDLIFAPIYGLSIYLMYRARSLAALIGGFGGAIEELLPTTDFIPSATLMWVYTFVFKKEDLLKQLAKKKK